MSQETKRQHFVPRTYLKNFGFETKKSTQIWVCAKEENNRLFQSNITNVALQNHFYSLKGETVEERQIIEKFYADNIEGDYNEVYQILVDPKKVKISDEERVKIILTILSLYYRNPIWVNKHNIVWESALKESYRMLDHPDCKERKIGMPDGTDLDCEGKSLEEVLEEVRKEHHQIYIMEHLKYTFSLVNARLKDNITVIKLGDDKEFITSDNPVIMTNIHNPNIVPFNVENFIKLPIDSKHQLVIAPQSLAFTDDANIFRRTDTGNISYMERMIMNSQQYNNSINQIFGSKEAIETYLSNKSHYEKELTPEEIKRSDKAIEKVKEMMKKLGIEGDWI